MLRATSSIRPIFDAEIHVPDHISDGARLEICRDCNIIPVTYKLSSLPGEFNMPSTVNLHLIGVWFCVGFFTGAGWAIATWLVGRIIFFI
jgi:hypothetical protein